VDMADAPQWPNKYPLPSLVDDKRKALEMTPCLKALVNCVIELHKASPEAYHYAEEFILWWIRLLGQRERMAFECPRFANPSRNPSSSKNSELYSCFLFSSLLDTNFVLGPNSIVR
jgi:hypothetical protein